MAATSGKSERNVVQLDTDDDSDFDLNILEAIERSARIASSSPLSHPVDDASIMPAFLASSSSSSSSSSPLSSVPIVPPPLSPSPSPPPHEAKDDSDDTSPSELTSTSVHQFSSFKDATSFLEQFALTRGFLVRARTTGSAAKERHGATYRCWCSQPPPAL